MSEEKKHVDFGVSLRGVSGFKVKRPARTTAVTVALMSDGAEVKLPGYHAADLEHARVLFDEDGNLLFRAENLDFGHVSKPVSCVGIAFKANGAIFMTQKFPNGPIVADGIIKLGKLNFIRLPML